MLIIVTKDILKDVLPLPSNKSIVSNYSDGESDTQRLCLYKALDQFFWINRSNSLSKLSIGTLSLWHFIRDKRGNGDTPWHLCTSPQALPQSLFTTLTSTRKIFTQSHHWKWGLKGIYAHLEGGRCFCTPLNDPTFSSLPEDVDAAELDPQRCWLTGPLSPTPSVALMDITSASCIAAVPNLFSTRDQLCGR